MKTSPRIQTLLSCGIALAATLGLATAQVADGNKEQPKAADAVAKTIACDVVGPDPWFATKLSFDQSTLPSGIEIVQTDPTYEPYALINRNLEPFYLVREINPVLLSPAYGNEYRFPNSELPEGYEPRYKITTKQVYFWWQLSSHDTKGWKPNTGGINNSDATRVSVGENIYILDGKCRQIFQDNRPAVVDIPTPQNFKVLGFYRGNPVEIKGTLSYSLNEKYDPQRGQQEPKTEPKSVFFETINLHSHWRLKWSFNYSTYKGIFRNENELKNVFGSIVNAYDKELAFWKKKREPQPVMPVIDFSKYSVIWYADGGSKASLTTLKEVLEYDDFIEAHVTPVYSDWLSSHLNLWTIPKTEKDIRFVETKEYEQDSP